MGRVNFFLTSTPQGRFCLRWNHPARPHKAVKGVAARTALARSKGCSGRPLLCISPAFWRRAHRRMLHWNHPARPRKVVKGVAAPTALARGQRVQRTKGEKVGE